MIEAAVEKVNQLAPFIVRWLPVEDTTTKRHNPPIKAVTFFYQPKSVEQRAETAAELARPKVGRAARRKGMVERIAAEDAALG